MNNKLLIFFFFLFLSFYLGISHADNGIELSIQKVLELGKDDLLFGSISSICEDDDSNFYVNCEDVRSSS